MRRSILQAGAWTALGLAAAFAVVSANSSHRRTVTTAAPAARATVTATSEPAKAVVAPATLAVKQSAPKAKVAAQAETPAFGSGAVIAIDAETGELGMPSPEQLVELQGLSHVVPSDLNTSDVGLVDVHHPNGMTTRDLQGRFQEVATISKAADGTFVIGCGQHGNHTPTVAPSALEEK
jgi:hypothetical protein